MTQAPADPPPQSVSTGVAAPGNMASGSAAITVGLLVLGASSYAFLTLGARALDDADFSAVSVTWSLVYALVGVFSPLEQETTRAVALRRLRGQAVWPVIRRAAALGAAAAILVAGLLGLLHRPIAHHLLGDQDDLVTALAVTLIVTGALFVTRGALAGTGRYIGYGIQLSVEGVVRVVAATALLVTASGTPSRFGTVLAVAAGLALLATVPLLPGGGGTPHPAAWGELTRNLAWLVTASVLAQVVANAGPAVLTLLAPHDEGLAGGFLAAFVIVRIPLFFVSALQGALLPRLVHAVEVGDHPAFAKALRQVLVVVAGLGALALAGLAALGPWAVSALLGGEGRGLGRVDLVVLGASSVGFVAAAVLQSAALALDEHRTVALVWIGGGVVFTALCLVPLQPLVRMDVAYLVTGFAVPALLLVGVVQAARRRRRGPRPASVV